MQRFRRGMLAVVFVAAASGQDQTAKIAELTATIGNDAAAIESVWRRQLGLLHGERQGLSFQLVLQKAIAGRAG